MPQGATIPSIYNQGDLGAKLLNAKTFIKYILNMISEIQDDFAKEYHEQSVPEYVLPPPAIGELRLKLTGAFERLE